MRDIVEKVKVDVAYLDLMSLRGSKAQTDFNELSLRLATEHQDYIDLLVFNGVEYKLIRTYNLSESYDDILEMIEKDIVLIEMYNARGKK